MNNDNVSKYYDNDDLLIDDMEMENIEEDSLINIDEADFNVSLNSTVPIPTFKEDHRIDYVAVMKDYNSDDQRLKTQAAEKIIGELTGLVLYIIKRKYSNYARKYYDDLIQSGEIGILTGLKEYDPQKSLPATYFYYYIVHEIQCFINDVVYKTTPYYSSNLKKINKAILMFENQGLPYTKRDLSIQTGIPLDTIEKVMSISMGKAEVSYDAIDKQIDAVSELSPENQFIEKESAEFIYKVMRKSLTQEEIKVLSYLFGLGEIESLSLKNISKKLNIPIDRVKKIKITALCKLKNSELSKSNSLYYRNDIIELDDADSISLFPAKEAIESTKELEEIEIEF